MKAVRRPPAQASIESGEKQNRQANMEKLLDEIMAEKQQLEDYAHAILAAGEVEETKEVGPKTTSLESYCQLKAQQISTESFGDSGGFLGVEDGDFDYILNVLVGIRRSLTNYTELSAE